MIPSVNTAVRLFRSLPIFIFAVVYVMTRSWATGFQVAGLVGLAGIALHRLDGDRLLLVMNTFIGVGGLGYLVGLHLITDPYDRLHYGVLFLLIAAYGCIFQILDPGGWSHGRSSIFSNDRYMNSVSWWAGWLVPTAGVLSYLLSLRHGGHLLHALVPAVLIGAAHMTSNRLANRADIRKL